MKSQRFSETKPCMAQTMAEKRRPITARLLIFLILWAAGVFVCGMISPLRAQSPALRSVAGVVLAADTGKPIAHALVRVASPTMEMRSVREQRPGFYDGRTDAQGRFTVQVPPNEAISLNAFAPGYEEAAGMWMSGKWTFQNVPFPSSPEQKFTLKLRPASYVTGVVTDESGHPFSGAAVEAALRGEDFTGYVAFDTTDAKGRFEIFDFPLKPEVYSNTKVHGQLTFQHGAKLTSIITNVYAMSETERTNLHVILRSGHEIKGVITSSAGPPAGKTVVEAAPADTTAAQRMSWTDAEGRFVIQGLPDGEVSVRAHSSAFDQQARKTIQLAGADAEVNLRMAPVVLKKPPRPVSLFGMKLANMTPELQTLYDLDSPTGVLILDPGVNHLRLGIGDLNQGDGFWMVGGKEIKNLPEMVAELLRIDGIAPPGDPNEGCHGSIRVVYVYRGGARTNTQRLKLTAEDISELKSQLRERIP